MQRIRVFIGSPSDLGAERRVVAETIREMNALAAHHRGLSLEPVGWEDTTPGIGRPQALINDDLASCQLAVMMLWKKWGMPSGRYSSGFAEEFDSCVLDRRPTILLFKSISSDDVADPGDQLRAVLAFRQEVESNRVALYGRFDGEAGLATALRRFLADYVQRFADGQDTGFVPSPVAAARRGALNSPESTEGPEMLAHEGLNRLRHGNVDRAGQLIEAAVQWAATAETLHAKRRFCQATGNTTGEAQASADLQHLHESTKDERALVYHLEGKGGHLQGSGKWKEAIQCFLDVEEVATRNKWPDSVAVAQTHIGAIHLGRQDAAEAVNWSAKAVATARENALMERLAICLNYHAYALDVGGDAEGAQAAATEAEGLAREFGLPNEVVKALTQRAKYLKPEQAREFFAEARTIAAKLADGDLQVIVPTREGFGLLHARRFPQALACFRDALTAAERSRHLLAVAQSEFNVGATLVYMSRRPEAESHLARARQLFKQLGHPGLPEP